MSDRPQRTDPKDLMRQAEEAAKRRFDAMSPEEQQEIRQLWKEHVEKLQAEAAPIDLDSGAVHAAMLRIQEVQAIAQARPDEAVTVRTATLEQMFMEIRARIGPGAQAQSCVYLGWCEGELPQVRTAHYCHGSKDLTTALLADILAKMPKSVREQTAAFENQMRMQNIGSSPAAQQLQQARRARKAAEFAKRQPKKNEN